MLINDTRTDQTVWEELRFIVHLSFAVLAVVGTILAVAL